VGPWGDTSTSDAANERLLEQGYVGPVSRFDPPKYLVENVISATVAFIGVLGLSFLVPGLFHGCAFLIRRYWGWLNA
jgi:hypothetical protein